MRVVELTAFHVRIPLRRVVRVDRVAADAQSKRGTGEWFYSLDFNERCQNVGYLLDFLNRVKERAPEGFDRIQYIEQPTRRDLKADRANVMHEASRLRPVASKVSFPRACTSSKGFRTVPRQPAPTASCRRANRSPGLACARL